MCPTLCIPIDCRSPESSIHGIFTQEYWCVLPCRSPEYLPNSGIESRFPTLKVDCFLSEPPGKSLTLQVLWLKEFAAAAAAVASVGSDSVQPHRQQSTRLHHPWDSPGKNTGVGCHFLLQCVKVKSESEVAQSCLTLGDPMDCSLPGSSIHGIF